eukprot:Skav233004  [mRNA]  locus=scaffold387:479388:480026:- [translate_table: standard]
MSILAGLLLYLAGAVRMENGYMEETTEEMVVDCSNLDPPPDGAFVKWTKFSEDQPFVDIDGVYKRNAHLGYVKNLEYDDCFKHFVFFPKKGRFAPVKQHEGLHVCYASLDEFCQVPDGSKVWNYAKKEVPKRCKGELCRMWKAKQHSWSIVSKFLKTKWDRATNEKGIGYEDAFKKCWDENSFSDLQPDFDDFARHYDVETSKATFNEKACK